MASINTSVPDRLQAWVQERIAGGHYATASDYVRDLIQRDQTQDGEREAIAAALVEGERSGVSGRGVPEIPDAIQRELHRQGE